MSVPEPSFLPAIIETDPFSGTEGYALAGFLAGYSGVTFEADALNVRQYASYCTAARVGLFDARRVHIEAFGRYLEATGRGRATIARRLCTVRLASLCEYPPVVAVVLSVSVDSLMTSIATCSSGNQYSASPVPRC